MKKSISSFFPSPPPPFGCISVKCFFGEGFIVHIEEKKEKKINSDVRRNLSICAYLSRAVNWFSTTLRKTQLSGHIVNIFCIIIVEKEALFKAYETGLPYIYFANIAHCVYPYVYSFIPITRKSKKNISKLLNRLTREAEIFRTLLYYQELRKKLVHSYSGIWCKFGSEIYTIFQLRFHMLHPLCNGI